ncbi:MAG: TIGR00341 family protein [Aggregatilineales bacterium]
MSTPDPTTSDEKQQQQPAEEAKAKQAETEKPKTEPTKPEKPVNSETIPDFARVALVPIANPETASDLLHLAVAMAHPEDGKVIALIVSTGTMENEAGAIEKLQPIIDQLEEEGNHITLETVSAPSIARGILDSARDKAADLIILGIRQHSRGQVVLGTVVENVIQTAPCDVLIYRTNGAISGYDRIVVPIDESIQAEAAARTGIRLAQEFNSRIEAMYVQARYRSQYEGLAHIERTLDGCPGHRTVKRTVLNASNPAQAILTRTTKEDLIIVGFTQRNQFERLIFGDLSQEILNNAEGPVILIMRSAGSDALPERLRRRVLSWIRPALTQVEQQEIIRLARGNSTVNIDYVMLIMVSATLASLGLLLNSAAVIIGAMLVAPFMSPLIAFSVSMTVGNPVLARRSVITLFVGIGLSLVVAAVIGRFLPQTVLTMEMTSRGSPTLLDAAVALASGVVGAYATARKDIPAALAGVAIAAALMPPLCTVGLGIALGETRLALGAALLFSTNIISIMLAGAVVFVWLGMSPRNIDEHTQRRSVVSLILVLTFALPIAFALFQLTRQANEASTIENLLRSDLLQAEMVEFDIFNDTNPTRILATVRSGEPITSARVAALELEIEAVVGGDYTLDLVVLNMVHSEQTEPEATDIPEIVPEITPELTPEATESAG